MNYYRCYVPNFSQIQAPLNLLLQKHAQWVWTTVHQEAYDKLKDELCREGNAIRQFREGKDTKLFTDWSKHGIGCVLGQVDEEGKEYMVACLSRSLNKHERNYSSFEGELLAVVWSVKSLRQYLHGHFFTIITDHQPLKWLMDTPDLGGKHARWSLLLQDYDFVVVHRPGAKHQNADTLSRFPRSSVEDITGARLDVELGDGVELPFSTAAMASMCQQHGVSLSAFSSHLHLNLQAGVFGAPGAEGFMDAYAPTADQLLEGHGRMLAAGYEPEPEMGDATAAAESSWLKKQSTKWCQAAAEKLSLVPEHKSQKGGVIKSKSPDVPDTVLLDTHLVGVTFFQAAEREGVVLVELFGGMCAGLEMCLRNGVRVQRYLYCDVDGKVQMLAQQRVHQLSARYPQLFPGQAFRDTFTTLPADVRAINTEQWIKAGAKGGKQWLVVGGWECQDLSPAGKGKGLKGARSSTFYDAARVTGALQQLQPERPPAFVWENTAFQYNWNSAQVSQVDYPKVCAAFGQPACLDAAQFGSRAHRARNFWTNLADTARVEAVVSCVVRPQDLVVNDILDDGRQAQLATTSYTAPQFYPCNVEGETLRALPTFVAVQGSRAFREGKPGQVWDGKLGLWVEPNPRERERAMGYSGDATEHPQLTEKDRHEITGRCMDANCVAAMLAICWELNQEEVCGLRGVPVLASATMCTAKASVALLPEGSEVEPFEVMVNEDPIFTIPPPYAQMPLVTVDPTLAQEFELMCMVAEVAAAMDDNLSSNLSSRDVWLDQEVLDILWYNVSPAGNPKRAKQRAKQYRWVDDKLLRLMPDGSTRTVPPPEERVAIVKQVHEQLGHFGVKRTRRLVMHSWWWAGIEDDVVRVLQACPHCKQLHTSFTTTQPTLHPLPVEGYLYRWSCDLAGPLPLTKSGNQYVFIAIEHFSKHIEVAAIPNKEAETTRAVFLSLVLCRFGACAEVVTDQGTEWQGAFHELLSQSFIDHRITSPSHPQANGLTERAVQTVKLSLGKHCSQSANPDDWDTQLHYIALGYRCSPQASTKVSPFELMYGVAPVLPMGARPAFVHAIEYSSAPALEEGAHNTTESDSELQQAAQFLLERAKAMEQHMVMVDANLKVAQHRDTLRYAMKREGKWQPRVLRYQAGDFVYRKRANRISTLQPKAADGIYRVHEVRDSGVLILQGKCGSLVPEHGQIVLLAI
jgi:hypothetical protein